MIIIQGKSGTGTKNELIKRFCKDTNSATLITDQLSLSEIFDKIKLLDSLDDLDWSIKENKNILTGQFVNCDADYYNIIGSINTKTVYMDLSFSTFKDDIIKFCLELEREYDMSYVMTETLSSDSEIEGIKIIKLGNEE